MSKEELIAAGVLVDHQDEWWLEQGYYVTNRKYVVKEQTVDGVTKLINLADMIAATPTKLITDHIDRNTLNHKRNNLRWATEQQNCANRGLRSDNRSGLIGVFHNPRHTLRPWSMNIGKDGKRYRSCHKTATEAALAYNRKALELFGEFASLNKI